MATPVFYTGDTHPPLSGTAKDANGVAVDISSADSMRLVAKESGGASTVIAGTAVNLTDGMDGKWKYVWAADDLTVAGSYVPELEVTWDSAATPPTVETFRDDAVTFTVKADND